MHVRISYEYAYDMPRETLAMNAHDLRDLHRRAIRSCAAVVAAVRPDHLERPTPCSEWTLRQLLAHMIGHNIGFAAAARGSSDAGSFADVALGRDAPRRFAASAQATVAAFDGVDLDDEIYLAVVRGGTRWPASTALAFHLVDSVVHGWDVAASLDTTIAYDDDVTRIALDVARAVPDDRSRTQPGATFQPSRPTSSDDALDQILAALGRDPHWARSRSGERRD